MLIGVLADTHVPKRARDLPAKAYQLLAGVDVIVHAGDVTDERLLDRLREIAPVFAVRGNNDAASNLPECIEACWDGVNVAVIHDTGPSKGRAQRLRTRFPQARVVIFGHSHIPLNDENGSLLLFNPGSPTDRRRQPKHTLGFLQLQGGTVSGTIVSLD